MAFLGGQMVPPTGVSVAQFSTDDVAPRERLTAWREALMRSMLSTDVEPMSEAPFRAQATIRKLPELSVLTGASSAARYQGMGKPAEPDDVVLAFGESDHILASQHGQETTAMRGDAFLLRAGAGTLVHVPEAGRITCLRLPRASIATRVKDLDGALCRRIPRDTPPLLLLKRYLGVLDEVVAELAMPNIQHSAVVHVHDLLALTLGATRDAQEVASVRGVRAARLNAMKDDILRNLKDQALSVGAIATRHNVTPRYVQRLFEDSGETFTEYMIAQRLMRAHRLASDPRYVQHTLTSIAFEVGFADLSYFNRAFRRRFGATPSDVRQRARRPD
jgi:AraC-like DNA-binding protein